MNINKVDQLNILIADNDEDDRDIIALAFKKAKLPHAIEFVKDGQELMDHLYNVNSNNGFPDLIVLDLNMPKKDGETVLKEIKGDFLLKHLDVVIFSTSKSEEQEKNIMESGAKKFFNKPASFEEMIEVVKNICNEIPSHQKLDGEAPKK